MQPVGDFFALGCSQIFQFFLQLLISFGCQE
jgi:hypothetical protein